ncbi:MAG: hypothetical protein CVT79_16290 [Alphaproteobacteria bacterium HGW-Alphaproteobacteria-18]|nr:MAG: hypothetical protein CVT79_16290 [Alphaproteobacteria bacterium HGW-Alphaproteobacteria-18]
MVPLVRSSAYALAVSVFLFVGAPALAQNSPPIAVSEPEYTYDAGLDFYDDDDFQEDYSDDLIETDMGLVEEAHAAYLRDADLQLTRPEQEDVEIEMREPPGWVDAIARFIESLAPVFRIIFWAAAALVVAGLVYFLFGEAIRMRLGLARKPKERPVDDVLTDIRPDADRARSLLEEADALAREGRFAEAVHLLLFRSIEDVQERLDGGLPTSLTAREIAGLGSLPDRARRALKPIIQIVESSFFGGRDVDADGWQSARRSYEDFAFGEGWA